MLHGQAYGMVGFQAPQGKEGQGKAIKVAILRAMYTQGKLTLAQACKIAKPSDHGKAIANGKVTIAALVAQGIDLHACEVAYNRATGNGATSKARKASDARNASAASVESKLLADNQGDVALTRLIASRKAQRNAAKVAKVGKVYTQAEIVALSASLAR